MSIRSSKSNQTLAVGTGTLVVQRGFDKEESTGDICMWFEHLIDERIVLRRVGEAETRVIDLPTMSGDDDNQGRIEVRCRVESGPVFGCWESDLQRQLEGIVAGRDGFWPEVFGFERRELTPADIDELATKVDDITVPLAERKRLEGVVRKLHQN